MTPDLFQALQTEEGRHLLDELAGIDLRDDALLPLLERLRRDHPAALVGAAVELARLRRRAAEKFQRADAMFFTRDALEMASAEPVARHTARRYAGLARVLDLCCGIGGDALALAAAAGQVTAVDRDPLALEMARANARVYGLTNLAFVQADVTEYTLGTPPDAIFIDPSRRETGRRVGRTGEAYTPPLSWCLGLTRLAPRVGIKASPALDYEETDAEVEIVSLDRECRETMLWLGGFRTCARRASVLPADVTLTDDGPTSDALGEIGEWLYEPDPAVIRAHLVQRLAGELGLRRIDAEVAYLTGDEVRSPFAAGFRVLEVIPWGLKRVNAVLAARGIGHAVIKKRAFPLTPEELRPKLKLKGPGRATLICTHAQGKPVVIIAA